ncbi:MAG: glycosyltransferase family 4 protein [Lachnospiraceae bacterium]|nr:glycosyltransferase family 4 protein [Lachnospiraceae bacterium]
MEVIFVTSALKGGGAERVMTTLANQFAYMGDTVTILMVAGDACDYTLDPAVILSCIGQASGGNPLKQVSRIFKMRRYFKRHPKAVLISFSTTINLFSILASLGLPNRLILSERNDPNRCNYKTLRNLIYSLKGHYVFQTADARDCFSEKIRKRSTVIPNPLRDDLPSVDLLIKKAVEENQDTTGIAHIQETDPSERRFVQNVDCVARRKIIVAAGRLEPQKNHRLLLDAFAAFHKTHPDYALRLYGRGSLESDLKRLATELGITESVVFKGFSKNILTEIADCAMYVLSSDYEGISNSLMEAMAIGLPVISTDCPIGGSRMLIQDGENGLLIPMQDVKALTDAMGHIANDPALAERIGSNAIKIREAYSKETVCAKWHTFATVKKQSLIAEA